MAGAAWHLPAEGRSVVAGGGGGEGVLIDKDTLQSREADLEFADINTLRGGGG